MDRFVIDYELKELLVDSALTIGSVVCSGIEVAELSKNIIEYVTVSNLKKFLIRSKELGQRDSFKFKKERLRRIEKLSSNPERETKRLFLALSKISDDEKIDYLANLYNNYLNKEFTYETFINIFYFLENTNKYEIQFARSLYEESPIVNEDAWRYIQILSKFGLVDITWGVLSGPSSDTEGYRLNKYGDIFIRAILDSK